MSTRRQFIHSTAAAGAALGLQGLLPVWARSASLADGTGLQALTGTEFDLDIARTSVTIDGKRGRAITINGTIPAPLLRWREGDTLTLRVTNHHSLARHPAAVPDGWRAGRHVPRHQTG